VSPTAKACPHCGVAYPADKLAATGDQMQKMGCALTILFTIPILLALAFC
jgi:hypothetical protein